MEPFMEEEERSSPSYYSVLGVKFDSSAEEIRRAYRRLAMQWHPDRWTRTPSLLGEANRKFQQIQEAYSVLSDEGKRTLYDAGLYDPEDEVDEGFTDFLEEMLSLMVQTRKEDKHYSMEELRDMFREMEEEMQTPSWLCGSFEDCGSLKMKQWDPNLRFDEQSSVGLSGIQMFGTSSCR